VPLGAEKPKQAGFYVGNYELIEFCGPAKNKLNKEALLKCL